MPHAMHVGVSKKSYMYMCVDIGYWLALAMGLHHCTCVGVSIGECRPRQDFVTDVCVQHRHSMPSLQCLVLMPCLKNFLFLSNNRMNQASLCVLTWQHFRDGVRQPVCWHDNTSEIKRVILCVDLRLGVYPVWAPLFVDPSQNCGERCQVPCSQRWLMFTIFCRVGLS